MTDDTPQLGVSGDIPRENDGVYLTISEAPPEPDDAAIARLAKLNTLEYERAREAEAESMGCRLATLDRLVEGARGGAQERAGQGHALYISRPELWPEAVDGAGLLDDLAMFFERHIFLPAHAAGALAVWTLGTYGFESFRIFPRVAFISPLKGCGKTTGLDALASVVCKPLPTSNVTAAAVFRVVEVAKPTLLIDEFDSFGADNDGLRNVLNAGHKRGGQVIRCVGDNAEPRTFAVFAPAAIAAIGKLGRFGTLEDRCIIIPMTRATRDERRAPFDEKAEAEGAELGRKCARWAADHAMTLTTQKPTLPPALFNRLADNWSPLLAIAELAGTAWPDRIAAASGALVPGDGAEGGLGVRLLADIRGIFEARGPAFDRIATSDLLAALLAVEGAPWAEAHHGRPLSAHGLGRLLQPFNIRSGSVRLPNGKTPKGYSWASFAEPFRRYLPSSPSPGVCEPPQRHNPQKTSGFAPQETPQADPGCGGCDGTKPAEIRHCGVVAVGKAPLMPWGAEL
ncbi:MAG: DUF3631 domain-containing protein [Acetobacteraceae bacterium]